jgi:hypothetical protein
LSESTNVWVLAGFVLGKTMKNWVLAGEIRDVFVAPR